MTTELDWTWPDSDPPLLPPPENVAAQVPDSAEPDCAIEAVTDPLPATLSLIVPDQFPA